MSSEWRDNLTNRIREICSSRRLPREAGERLWNTGSPVKYGRSGNLVWDWNLRALIYCSQSDALTIRPLRPQSTLCYRNSTCGWCCSLQFKANGLDAVKRPILHHRTKFSIGLAVAEISRFFCDVQDGNRLHLGFSKNSICRRPICITVPNVTKIGQTVADTWRFKMAAVRHLGFVGRVLGPPTKTTWWSVSLC